MYSSRTIPFFKLSYAMTNQNDYIINQLKVLAECKKKISCY